MRRMKVLVACAKRACCSFWLRALVVQLPCDNQRAGAAGFRELFVTIYTYLLITVKVFVGEGKPELTIWHIGAWMKFKFHARANSRFSTINVGRGTLGVRAGWDDAWEAENSCISISHDFLNLLYYNNNNNNNNVSSAS